MVLFTRGLPLTSFIIASTALAFQVGVLYPWHHELDTEFKELKQEYRVLLAEQRAEREQRLKELSLIREEIQKVAGAKGKGWF